MISVSKLMFATYNCCFVRFDGIDAVFSFYFHFQALFSSKEEFAAAVRKETEALRQQVRDTCRQIKLYQRFYLSLVGLLVAKLQIRTMLVGSSIFRVGAEFDFRWCFHEIQIPIHVLMNQRSVVSWITMIGFLIQFQMVVVSSILICIYQMKEEATIRDMESKELTERNQQLKRETGELRQITPVMFKNSLSFLH